MKQPFLIIAALIAGLLCATGLHAGTPAIHLSGNPVTIDSSVGITLTGFEPQSLIVIEATLEDDKSLQWRSRATFLTDGAGELDLARDAPVGGDYAGADANGLFWSMSSSELLDAAPEVIHSGRFQRVPHYESDRDEVVTLSALTLTDEPITSVQLVRQRFPHNVVGEEIAEGRLRGQWFQPQGSDSPPAVLLLRGSGGGIMRQDAALMAAHGFAVFALAFFKYTDLPDHQERVPLEYFAEALDYMQQRLGHRRIAVQGLSKGGEATLVIASYMPDRIAAAVPVVPAHIVVDTSNRYVPPWTLNGEVLPYLGQDQQQEVRHGDHRPKNVSGRRISRSDLLLPYFLNEDWATPARIPVEQITAPLLIVSGGDDQAWPSYYSGVEIMKRLDNTRHTTTYRHLLVRDAGHRLEFPGAPTLYLNVPTPVNVAGVDMHVRNGGSPAGNAAGQRLSWETIIQFYKDVL